MKNYSELRDPLRSRAALSSPLRVRFVLFLAESFFIFRASVENRNVKFEIRNKFSIFKIQITKTECTMRDITTGPNLLFWTFEHYYF
jgi:hypothetical protein